LAGAPPVRSPAARAEPQPTRHARPRSSTGTLPMRATVFTALALLGAAALVVGRRCPSAASASFRARYDRALRDPRLAGNLLAFQRAWRPARDAAFTDLAAQRPGAEHPRTLHSPIDSSQAATSSPAKVAASHPGLGEWIVQLAHERPSHMVMPAIHKSRQQVGDLFTHVLGREISRESVPEQVQVARDELRHKFLEADIGISGANALIAESGTIM